MDDRLAEIESRHNDTSEENWHQPWDDVEWLIAEVKRLRKVKETLALDCTSAVTAARSKVH
jgi:hypothetical protein